MSPETVYTGSTLIVEGYVFDGSTGPTGSPVNLPFDWSGLGMTARIVIEDRDHTVIDEISGAQVTSPALGTIFGTFTPAETASWDEGLATVTIWLNDVSGAKFPIETFPLSIRKRA